MMEDERIRQAELIKRYNDGSISDDEFKELIGICFGFSLEEEKKTLNNPAFAKRLRRIIDIYRNNNGKWRELNLVVGDHEMYVLDADGNRKFTLTNKYGRGGIRGAHTMLTLFDSHDRQIMFGSNPNGRLVIEDWARINGVICAVDTTKIDEYGIDISRIMKQSSNLEDDIFTTGNYEVTSILRDADPSIVDVRFNRYENGQPVMSRGERLPFDSRDDFDVLSTRYTDTKYQWPDVSENVDYSNLHSKELEEMLSQCDNDITRTELTARAEAARASK